MTPTDPSPEGRTVAEGLAEVAVDGAKEIIALRADRDALVKRVGELTEALVRARRDFSEINHAESQSHACILTVEAAERIRTTLTKGTNNG